MAHGQFWKDLLNAFKKMFGSHEPMKAMEQVYNDLAAEEQIAVTAASGYIAIINASVDKVPDEILSLIQRKYKDATKESVHHFLNGIITKLKILDGEVPDTFEEAMAFVQQYMKKYEGNTWVTIVKAVVAIGTEVLMPGIPFIQKIEFCLEYVYKALIQPKATEFLPAPAAGAK